MTRKATLGFLLTWLGALLIAASWLLTPREASAAWQQQVIRLHVVANSDSEADQALKRAVRDAILDQVTPLFEGAATRDEAKAAIAKAEGSIIAAAERVIAEQGFDYPVRLELGRAEFPGKAYGALFLPAGEYDALKVLIGEAKGANWWCVLFPPLCFVDWAAGVVEEPKPETEGTETVRIAKRELMALVDEEGLKSVKVEARFALLDWFRGKGKNRQAEL